ncbi:hypothetical protein [Minwuia thermotolerans]|uniref:DUF429 domain-containing protein n=1 Tax=Minwuia thermotolerans TaxID=2056226 RepID=A0A2M9G6R1_9PROT|nr:hypothetical protein [Minwuia thermotolerans]PJK31391.1 hypothetical protein CVT23_01550 [Minwuia thermotolerans]
MVSEKHPEFELLAVVDFSAAASPGPKRPTENRCWAALAVLGRRLDPVYCRTRQDLLELLHGALAEVAGPALIAWDFPFGYPVGSGLGGGRAAAQLLFGLVEDGPKDANNRFDVADRLNRRIGNPPGPFWGRPRTQAAETVYETRPPFGHHGFTEWRLVERQVREAGHKSIQSVWKLAYAGSVGSQALMGLALIERLNRSLDRSRRTLYWPFETGWNADLDGVVHVECWPTLFPFEDQPYAIRDARQVAATRDGLLGAQNEGYLVDMLAAPASLTAAEREAVMTEEGWILGFPSR